MNKWKTIADIRREYGNLHLNEEDIPSSPLQLFEKWFSEVLAAEKSDPTAMVLSTVDEQSHPDSRVVLLKGIENNAFIFYTNYESRKAQQFTLNPYAALNFYWPAMARQVRIRGSITKTSTQQSDLYFASRPRLSQYSAVSSPQSREVGSRAELELRLNELITKHGQAPLLRPLNWGGFQVLPEEFEFWQGRDNRLHDRIQYVLTQETWSYRRLAP